MLGWAALAACSAPAGGPSAAPPTREAHLRVTPADPAPGGPTALPEDWSSCSLEVFEHLVDALASGPPPAWDAQALGVLAHALTASDEGAVRAVVLLAHDPSSAVEDLLLTRIEGRRDPGRAWNAADLLAATALGRRASGPGTPADRAPRLVALAQGPAPHPDLEVRVECAASALRLGREEVVPFLVRVLRARTPAERDDPPDWPRVDTLYWVKWRAAGALAEGLGVEADFRPDGSWQHQMERADALAAAYAERAAAAAPAASR